MTGKLPLTEEQIKDEVFDGKNKNNIRCQFCFSLILKKDSGQYVENVKTDLPLMHQKHSKDSHSIATEPLDRFWLVKDMLTFENVGFSNTVDHTKFLTCADCDMGPVGFHDITSKLNYVALNRVTYGDEPDDVVEPAE